MLEKRPYERVTELWTSTEHHEFPILQTRSKSHASINQHKPSAETKKDASYIRVISPRVRTLSTINEIFPFFAPAKLLFFVGLHCLFQNLSTQPPPILFLLLPLPPLTFPSFRAKNPSHALYPLPSAYLHKYVPSAMFGPKDLAKDQKKKRRYQKYPHKTHTNTATSRVH